MEIVVGQRVMLASGNPPEAGVVIDVGRGSGNNESRYIVSFGQEDGSSIQLGGLYASELLPLPLDLPDSRSTVDVERWLAS